MAGGREGNVGVGGLLLGGGNTFFTARKGFACDNVVGYEVVLADGRVVQATAEENEDLFRVLKGGGNNFGVVTSFTMETVVCGHVWGGMTFFGRDQITAAIEGVKEFTDRVEEDVHNNLVCIFTYMPDFKEVVVATLYANVKGVEKPRAYEKWFGMKEMMSMVKMTSVKEMAFEHNIPAGY